MGALNRSSVASKENWWLYCPRHMYGRKIEGGRVIERRVFWNAA